MNEGKTEIKMFIRSLLQYKKWRLDVMRKDKWTCVECGSKDKIQVDHIKPFSKIIKEENITSVKEALRCDILWDISNGRVLCLKCHLKTETWGNRNKNNKKNVSI